MRQRHNHKKGFSLVEAAIVLGVVGLVIGGIWVGASAVSDSFKASRTAEGILSICTNTANAVPRNLVPAGTGATDITDLAIAMKTVPEDWVSSTRIDAPAGRIILYQMEQDRVMGYSETPDIGGFIAIYLADAQNKYCRRILSYVNKKSSARISSIRIGRGPNDDNDWIWDPSPAFFDLPTTENLAAACSDIPLTKIEFLCRAN